MNFLATHRNSRKSVHPNASRKVIPFPRQKAPNKTPLVSDDPRLTFLFQALDGHGNSRKKALIVLAANADVGLLSREEASQLVIGLGLECV